MRIFTSKESCIASLLVWLQFLLFLHFAVGGPPTLNTEDVWVFNYAERANESLEIVCQGNRPLQWHVLQYDPKYHNITQREENNESTSVFKIRDPHYEDTGNFTCCYSDQSNTTSSVGCLLGPQNSATTFVYVHDGKTPFVKPASNAFRAKIRGTIVLDCRTTHPDITVQVYKEDKNVTSEFDVDPYFRFSKEAEDLLDGGFYECRDNMFNKKIQWHVSIYPEPLPLHKPNIKEHENSYHVIGLPLQMNCSIPFSKDGMGSGIDLEWDLPNQNTIHSFTESIKEQVSIKTKVSSLLIPSPTLEDSGNYSCTARQGSQRKSSHNLVQFQSQQDSFVEIEKPPKFLSIIEGGNFKWISHVKVYPKDPIVMFYNPFNSVLEGNDRVSIDFIYESGQLTLRINSVKPEDFGIYRANVSTNDGLASDIESVIMFVNATPKVEIQEPTQYFSIGEGITVIARILSYGITAQRPDVSWWFSTECESYRNDSSCSPLSDSQALNYTLESAGGPKNRWLSTVSFEAESSGYVFCRAENGYGTNISSALVIVSDIEGIFVFSLTSEAGRQAIYSTKTLIDVIEGDEIEFKCSGLLIFYETTSLTADSLPMGSEIRNCSTSLSAGECLTLPEVTSEASGLYSCEGVKKASDKEELRSLELNVKEKKAPYLDETLSNVSLSGTDISVKVQSPFSLLCVVEGRPEPSIQWLKDGIDVESIPDFVDGDSVLLLDRNQKLEFKFARSKYEGIYTCKAASRVGEISPYATVTIVDKQGFYLAIICGAIASIVLLAALVGYLVYRVRKEKRHWREVRKNQLFLFEQGNVGDLNPDCLLDEQADLLPYDKAFEVSKDKIHLGKHLGGGAFGQVVLAEVEDLREPGKRATVAVKMCKDTADPSHLKALTVELKIMIYLGKHLNIVSLMGAHTVQLGRGELWILVEYCKYGNLLRFIHKNKKRYVNQIDPSGVIDPSCFLPRYSSSSNQPSEFDGYSESRSRTPSSPTRPNPLTLHGESFSEHPNQPDNDTFPRAAFYAANPHYSELAFRNNSTSDSLPASPPIVINSDGGNSVQCITSEKFFANFSKRHPSCSSTQGSESGGLRMVNTDMTRLTTPGPISPSEVFYDTHGNTFALIEAESHRPFNTSVLVNWAWQIANGMEYLSKRKVLHGDLAARNILLCEDNVVKICDFGLSRNMYKNDVYTKKNDGAMPIKWMSLEAIQDRIFSTQSDVWAYGVTLWELFTLGNTPYPEVHVDRDFVLSLEEGRRMEKPKYCNELFYDLMLQCWNKEPMDRPSFDQIRDRITPLMDEDTQNSYVAMNAGFANANQEWFSNRTDYIERVLSPEFSKLQDQDPDLGYTTMLTQLPQGPHIIVPVTCSSDDHYLPMHYKPGSTPPSAAVFSPRPFGDSSNVFTFHPNVIPLPNLNEANSPDEASKLLQMQLNVSKGNNNNTPLKRIEGQNAPFAEEKKISSFHNLPNEILGDETPIKPGEVTYANVPREIASPYVTAAVVV